MLASFLYIDEWEGKEKVFIKSYRNIIFDTFKGMKSNA